MARKHMLQGLMDWAAREPWLGELNAALEDHLLPTCDETGLEFNEIISILGEDLFMSTVWACAFEDLLTREFEDGSNIVDEYLKRRGWKETAAFRAYIGALRNSMVSLYEVSDVVPDTSFRARDLVRGGEPMLISERLATRYLKQWDRFSGRVLQIGQQAQISGAVLQYDLETSENLLKSIRGLGKLTQKEKRQLAKEMGDDFDPSAITGLSVTEKLRRLSPVFTASWLLDMLDRMEQRDLPDLLNSDGDDLIACTVDYQLTDGAADGDVRAALNSCADLRPETATLWNWVRPVKRKSASNTQAARSNSRKAAPTNQGELLLGSVHLDGRTLVLSTNSFERSERGIKLLSALLGEKIGPPLLVTKSFDELDSDDVDQARQVDLSEQEQRAIIHETMDRHYRETLDQPVPSLGNKSPRAAVKTAKGRAKVVDWLKLLENRTAAAGKSNDPMASYSFDWMWAELGVAELRR